MKKLFEASQKFLGEEAKNFNDFVNTNIDIYIEEGRKTVKFYLIQRVSQTVFGTIEIDRVTEFNNRYGDCLGAWQVSWSEANKGYGPLMYDIAMEYATSEGAGLTCDRLVVSDSAYKVWQYYLNNRSDVEHFQLDDLNNTLTPTEKDNCFQDSAKDQHAKNRDKKPDFPRSPLSKMYRKKGGETIKKFKEMGRWRMEVSYDALDHVEYNDMNDVIDWKNY